MKSERQGITEAGVRERREQTEQRAVSLLVRFTDCSGLSSRSVLLL